MMMGIGMKMRRRGGVRTTLATLLSKYGTNAHVYLPGVGTISGLTAGNYLDSAGVTAASVDNPVGLSLDALQAMTLGANVVVNGDFATDTVWSKGPQTTIAGGKATIASTGAASALSQGGVLDSAKTYLATFDATVRSGTGKLENGGGGTYLLIDATKTYSCCFTGSAGITFNRVTACDIDVDNVVFKEITGIHASQATTASKPILRLNSGKYSWQFDGSNDSLALGSVPFQQVDDHIVVAVVNPNATGRIFAISSTAGTNPRIADMSINASGYAFVFWRDDAAVASSVTGSVSLLGTPHVITAWVAGGVRKVRVDGVQIGTDSTVLGTTTPTSATIGALALAAVGNNINANIHSVIPVKGTFALADVIALERLAAQQAGITI